MGFIYFLISAIFTGACFASVFLLFISIFHIRLKFIDKLILTETINISLLLGAYLTIIWVAIYFFNSYYHGGEYERYVHTSRFIGPSWLHSLGLLFTCVFLPQMMWIKRCLRSAVGLFIIATLLLVLNFDLVWMSSDNSSGWSMRVEFPVFEYLKRILIYIPVVSIIYWIVNKRAHKN